MADHLPYYGHEQGCYNSRIPWRPEPCPGCVALRRAFSQGQRDEREAIDAEITADLTARMQREREDRDPDLLLGGIDYALQNVLRVIRARGEKRYDRGYADALDAARKAVARQQRHFHGWDYSCIDPENALATIDALKEGSND